MPTAGAESSPCHGAIISKSRDTAKVPDQVLGVCERVRQEEPGADQERIRNAERPRQAGQGEQAAVAKPLFPDHEPGEEAAGARAMRDIRHRICVLRQGAQSKRGSHGAQGKGRFSS